MGLRTKKIVLNSLQKLPLNWNCIKIKVKLSN